MRDHIVKIIIAVLLIAVGFFLGKLTCHKRRSVERLSSTQQELTKKTEDAIIALNKAVSNYNTAKTVLAKSIALRELDNAKAVADQARAELEAAINPYGGEKLTSVTKCTDIYGKKYIGWCNSSKKPMYGNQSGPFDGSCNQWIHNDRDCPFEDV